MNNKAPLPVSAEDRARELLACAIEHYALCNPGDQDRADRVRAGETDVPLYFAEAMAAIGAAQLEGARAESTIRAEIGAKVEGLREALDMQGRALNAFLELIGSDELSPGVFGGNYHWLRDPTFEEGQAALEANNTAAAALSLLGHEPGEEGGR